MRLAQPGDASNAAAAPANVDDGDNTDAAVLPQTNKTKLMCVLYTTGWINVFKIPDVCEVSQTYTIFFVCQISPAPFLSSNETVLIVLSDLFY